MKPLQVLLAGRHALVRAAIRALIDAIEGVDVIGEAGDVGQTLRLIKQLQPDVVLLDTTLVMNEVEVLQKTTRQFPGVRVIVLASGCSGESQFRVFRAGAAGYIPKNANIRELVDAISTVARGGIYVSQDVFQHTFVGGDAEHDLLAKLTPRQREVLAKIVDGDETREIARSLNISVKTVETYRSQLMERLDIYNVAGLVRFAIRTGLIDIV